MKITKSLRSKDSSTTFGCTYHGWVMIPLDLGGGRKLPHNDTPKMVRIGKKVARSQMAARQDGDRAVIALSSSGVLVTSVLTVPDAAPLLSASMDTISCMLLSKDTGIAVIMAFTWDHHGKRGVGCDVIKFHSKPKKTVKQFGLQFNKSMALQNRIKAAAATMTAQMSAVATGTLDDEIDRVATVVATGRNADDATGTADDAKMQIEDSTSANVNGDTADENPTLMEEAEDDFDEEMSSFSGGGLPSMSANRRRSSAMNETDDGGYLAVDTVSGGNAGYLVESSNSDEEDNGQYITVHGRRSTSFSFMSAESMAVSRQGSVSSDVDM